MRCEMKPGALVARDILFPFFFVFERRYIYTMEERETESVRDKGANE